MPSNRFLGILVIAVALLFPGAAVATAQAPDRIRIGGEDRALHTNPLDGQLARLGWSPPEDAVITSANWRGYIANWEVRDEWLVLTDVTIRLPGAERGDDARKSILAELFPSAREGVVADWYSGALIVPDGDLVHYVHMGYGSTYERYQVLRIESGRVVEHLRLSRDAFEAYKDAKFEAFTATQEYKQAFEELCKEREGMSDEQIRDFMKSYFAERYLSL